MEKEIIQFFCLSPFPFLIFSFLSRFPFFYFPLTCPSTLSSFSPFFIFFPSSLSLFYHHTLSPSPSLLLSLSNSIKLFLVLLYFQFSFNHKPFQSFSTEINFLFFKNWQKLGKMNLNSMKRK